MLNTKIHQHSPLKGQLSITIKDKRVFLYMVRSYLLFGFSPPQPQFLLPPFLPSPPLPYPLFHLPSPYATLKSYQTTYQVQLPYTPRYPYFNTPKIIHIYQLLQYSKCLMVLN